MKILQLAIIMLMMAGTVSGQLSQQKQPRFRTSFFPRVTELHLTNPLYQSIPSKGTFSGSAGNRTLYTASSKRGKLDGIWISWYEDKSQCDSGAFVKGLPNGEWRRWDKKGNLLSIRTYDADRYQRITQEMAHAHPKAVVYPLTRIYQQNKNDGLLFLHADYSFPAHTAPRKETLEEHVLQNTSGDGTYHPVFHRGLHHGLFMNFSPDGHALDSGYYKNGLREGAWVHRLQNGEREEGPYKNGHRAKEWKKYNAAGKLILLSIYNREGRLQWQKVYEGAR